jgi:hypothetical protein
MMDVVADMRWTQGGLGGLGKCKAAYKTAEQGRYNKAQDGHSVPPFALNLSRCIKNRCQSPISI